jgi:adenosylcobinamide-phosphate synthase
MMPDHILALMAGFVLDLLIGDPEWFPHPVKWIGGFIGWMEKRLRARGGNLRVSAVFLTASTVLLTMAATALVLFALSLLGRWPLFAGMAVISWLGLSARNLADEARGVEAALSEGIEAGRKRVARIVGRDTAELDEHEVVCATVETVAENTTDGVISPILYAALGGPVLMMGFKAASTLDSMVGYLDPKYRDIGWSSAKLDDLLNYLPARLCAGLMCAAAALAGLDWKAALRIVKRDHANHLSPNCAWSEAAAAGALGIQLGGTHRYFGKPVEKPTIGDGRRAPERKDIARTIRLLYGTGVLAMLLALLAAWAL